MTMMTGMVLLHDSEKESVFFFGKNTQITMSISGPLLIFMCLYLFRRRVPSILITN